MPKDGLLWAFSVSNAAVFPIFWQVCVRTAAHRAVRLLCTCSRAERLSRTMTNYSLPFELIGEHISLSGSPETDLLWLICAFTRSSRFEQQTSAMPSSSLADSAYALRRVIHSVYVGWASVRRIGQTMMSTTRGSDAETEIFYLYRPPERKTFWSSSVERSPEPARREYHKTISKSVIKFGLPSAAAKSERFSRCY